MSLQEAERAAGRAALRALSPEEIEGLRRQLVDHKSQTGQSWAQLAQKTGVPQGTLSQFGIGSYTGDNLKIAGEVAKYFVNLEAAAEAASPVAHAPGFQMTQTARRVISLCRWAQKGRMGAFVGGPGVGKTAAIRWFKANHAQVWVVTLSPSTKGVNTALLAILAALGDRTAKGTPLQLSLQIRDRVRNARGLIILDEAQHAVEETLEELRAIHDETRVGLVLIGNETTLTRLEGGSRAASYAQLYSRVGMRGVQPRADEDDVRLMIEAWGVVEAPQVRFLSDVARKPGGLRNLTMVMELAADVSELPAAEIPLEDLRLCWAQLSTRAMA